MKQKHIHGLMPLMIMLAADAATAVGGASPAAAPAAAPATDTPAASAAGETTAAPKKQRESVHSKEILVDTLQPEVQKRIGHRVSKQDIWELYKLIIAVSAQLASEKPLSLAGVGRFSVLNSQRSVKAGKPAKRLRFRASSAITTVLNDGGNFIEEMTHAPEEDTGSEDTDADKPAAGDTEAGAAAAAKPAKSKGNKPAKATPAPAAPVPAGAATTLEEL